MKNNKLGQAGGARVLRKFSRSLLAKPYCKREAWFYKKGIENFKKVISFRSSRYEFAKYLKSRLNFVSDYANVSWGSAM